MKDVGSINQLRDLNYKACRKKIYIYLYQVEKVVSSFSLQYLYQVEKVVSSFSLQERRGGENCNIELSWRICTQTQIAPPFFVLIM